MQQCFLQYLLLVGGNGLIINRNKIMAVVAGSVNIFLIYEIAGFSVISHPGRRLIQKFYEVQTPGRPIRHRS